MKIHPTYALVLVALTAPLLAQKSCGGRVKLQNIWTALSRLHDKDGDGKITKKEFTRGDKQFKNHDRDGNGLITAADFPEGRFWNGFAPGMGRRADRDRDGVVTKKEWKVLTSRLDQNGDGEITMKELGGMAPAPITKKPKIVGLMFDQDGDGKIEVSDFATMFADLDRNSDGKLDSTELRGNRSLLTQPSTSVPKVGKMAPDFELPRADDSKKTVKLSSFRGDRPVALIFGSYT